MKKIFLIFSIFFIFGFFKSQILLGQSNLLSKNPEKREGQDQVQLKGKLLETLKRFGVDKTERERFVKDLRNKFSSDKNDEDDTNSYVNELTEEKPTVVWLKLSNGETALVIALNPFQGAVNSIFLSVSGKMKFIGTLLDDAKYKMFKPMLFESPSGVLVFVSNQTNSGTGVAAYDYDIYRIADKKLISLGSIPLEGFENEWHNYLTINYKSEFKILKKDTKDQLQIKVKYKFGINSFQFSSTGGCISNNTPEKELYLFDDDLTFNYDIQYFPRGNKEAELIFERNCAAATNELKNSVFVKNHFEKLKTLAKNGKKSQKCWLRELLKDSEVKEMDDQYYRKELLTILNEKN